MVNKIIKIALLLTSQVCVMSRQMSSYLEHRWADHKSHIITNKSLLIALFFCSEKKNITGAKRQLNANNKAPTIKLLFSSYLSWFTHNPPARLQPAIQLSGSECWLASRHVFLSASFLFNLSTLKAAWSKIRHILWKALTEEPFLQSIRICKKLTLSIRERLFSSVAQKVTSATENVVLEYTDYALGLAESNWQPSCNFYFGVVSCVAIVKIRKFCSVIPKWM